MVRLVTLLLLLWAAGAVNGQKITGPELLEKAIAFHDPGNNWATFKDSLQVIMQTPNSSERVSNIYINSPQQLFFLDVSRDNVSYTYRIEKDNCDITFNGKSDFSEADAKKHRLNCERGRMMKNYYTYLYGLPMKLKDSGTIIDSKVHKKQLKGKEYLVLKATYVSQVGDDTWYFYFDPNTHAMEVYQFYHDESLNDGEYILLDGLEEISGIKMPKTRKWYYNKDDGFLGTDTLQKLD